MSILHTIRHWVTDPPPEYVFELSEKGIAWARTDAPGNVEWTPLPEGTIAVSPLGDNVKSPGALAGAVRAIAPPVQGRRRRAALILPDYCARVAVLDFDTFPTDHEEQLQLTRFRIKRTVPFDIESAVVACHAQPRSGEKKVDVTVVAMHMDIASHYEAPFRAAGFHCGFVTLSALAALPLMPEGGPAPQPCIVAKLSGQALAVSLLDNSALRMFRCVELDLVDEQSVLDILAPSFAFAEDETGQRPKALLLTGFGHIDENVRGRWSDELEVPVASVRSRFGQPASSNAGLYGFLESSEN